MIENIVMKCSVCDVPFVYDSIYRDFTTTVAIYICPNCGGVCLD